MVTSLLIFCSVFTLIQSDNTLHCTDECLLSKLNEATSQSQILLPSYNILNNIYMDRAQIWINPCDYFSHIFIQTLTNKKHPTNYDFRESFYNKYIKPNNLSLILQITNNKNIDIASINTVISKYRFDGYVYSHSHNRKLLGDYYTDESNQPFDILNQHTWDIYDFFLFTFSVCSFGLCCLCCGWCSHKKYVSDKIVEDEDIADLKVSFTPNASVNNDIGTPITNNNKKEMLFNGFTIFGDKIIQSPDNKLDPNDMDEYNYNETIPSVTNTQMRISNTNNIPIQQQIEMQNMMNSMHFRPSDIDLNVNNINPKLLQQLQMQQTPTIQSHTNNTNVGTPIMYETDNAIVKIVSPTLIKQTEAMQQQQQQQQQRSSIPARISLPTATANIIPKYKSNNPNFKSPQTAGIDCVASPDSAEPSESHISIDMFVKRVGSNGSDLHAIGYTPTENSMNKMNSVSEDCNPYDKIDDGITPVPLKNMKSIQLNGLGIINEGNEHIQNNGTKL